ncbi:ABC transporter substrate-binding protein [soil metagenome]
MNLLLRALAVACVIAAPLGFAQTPAGYPADYAKTIAAANREGKVVVYSVLSNRAAEPLVQGFNALYPEIKVEYDGEKGSTEMHDWFVGEVAKGQASADVLWSSAMDLQIKLVMDGYAASYESPEAAKLPGWANYQHQAYGTTLEPIVFVYNKDLVKADEVPQDHAAFARLLTSKTDKFKGKVTTFDIEKSGVGFMFAVADKKQFADLPNLLKSFGTADYRPSPGTGTMLTKINAGEYLLGYNIMGAYAMVRSKKDLPSLGVAFPKDYTLLLSRVMFISREARHPNAARLWTDYLLSLRGQKILGDALELHTIRNDVDAQYTASKLLAQIGASARPIPMSPEVTKSLAPERHQEFIRQWNAWVAAGR